MSTKTVEHAFVKAVATAIGQHEIEFYAIAFSGEPDHQGDIIDPGAADEWLEKFYAKGKPLPISFRHAAMLGESRSDPFSVIGWAPADPMHVWKDDHGIRVRAYLETEINDKAAQVYRLAKNGILTGASAVMAVHPDDEVLQPDHSTRIMRLREIKEAGLCLDPANEDAYLIAVKADEAELEELAKAWNGNAAMTACKTASDYRSICAGEHTFGEPDERRHWALPHHDRPGAPANPDGVRAARSRFPQTEQLKDRAAVRSHLFETHKLPTDSERAAELDPEVMDLVAKASVVAKAGRSLSKKNEQLLRTALSMIEEALTSIAALQEDVAEGEEAKAKANAEEPHRANAEEPTPNAWIHEALASFEEPAEALTEVNAPA
jgi:HK97 family phage prohead protease